MIPILQSWKRRLVLALAALLMLASCEFSERMEDEKEEYDEMGKLMEWEFNRSKDPFTNSINTQKLLLAKDIRDEKFMAMESMRSPVPGISWIERGANNVGGRTRVLAFDLRDSLNGYKKVWAGGVGGGLWYTKDITVSSPTWVKVNDLMDNLAISAFVQDPANPMVMYVGTGEGWFNVDAQQGAGIWKSTDGGASFARLSSTSAFYYIQDLLIDQAGNLYAAVRKNSSGLGSSGILKSNDAGAGWATVLTSPVSSTDQGGDLELAANGDIYASVGTAFSNGGIYRSSYATHGGLTGDAGKWVNITPNLSGIISTPSNYWNRIELACAPSDASVVYALFQGYNTLNCTSIQQYNSGTNSWTVRTVPTIVDQGANSNFSRSQAFYNLVAAVDPNNAASLYIGGIDALRSDDTAKTWTQMSTWSLYNAPAFTASQYVHADHHAICFAPQSSSRAIWGTDGGIFYSTDANVVSGKPGFASKNSGYNVTQYYSVAMHPTTSDYFLAGAQDNGTHKFSAAGLNNITEVTSGDGGLCYIDQDNPLVQITSYTYNNYFVSTNGGSSFTMKQLNNRGSFINASDYDNTANILYSGDDAGYFFRWTNPQSAGAVQDKVAVPAFSSSKVSMVKVSSLTTSRVYFGLYNGSLVKVDNANPGTSLTGNVLKTGTGVVSGLAIDPADENHMIVTYSNYGVTSVYESRNALAASPVWTSVEGDLPDMPVRSVLFDPRNSDWAILATELGIWSTNDLNGVSTSWSPTNSGLANVRVEMLRYRSSDRTIAAATHGRGLYTATVPSTTTPDINFATGTGAATEFSGSSASCRNYRDYPVNLTIANPPTGAATVNLSVSSSTAIEGSDFDYTTSGSFLPVSHSLVFANGATDSKTITIRVYDDAEPELVEQLILSYSISGTTDAVAGIGSQTYTFSINDDDAAPVAYNSSTFTVGAASVYIGDPTGSEPFDATLSSMRTQMLYNASELNAAGITAGVLTNIAFNLSKQSTRPYQDLSIKLGTTSSSYLINGSLTSVPVTVYKSVASYTTVDGWNNFQLDQPFTWNGTDNIVVELCYNNGTAAATDKADVIVGYSDGGSSGQSNFFFQEGISCTASFSTVSYYGSGYKPQVQFTREVTGTTVAHNLSSVTEYFGPNATLYCYNTSGEIMASIHNLTNHDYGCTQVDIDRTGLGATDFNTTFTSEKLMDKTFHITPTNANPTGSYEITLYYSASEVQGWETITGNSFADIRMVKTKTAISNVTTASPNGAGSVEIVTPTISTLGSNYAISYTFSSGFSGFGAGIPSITLSATQLPFNGLIQNASAILAWRTLAEKDNKGFYIERSADGVHFEALSFLASKGNRVTGSSYTYTDFTIQTGTYYYRLRLVDKDNKAFLSRVILLSANAADLFGFQLQSNPVKDNIDLLFSRSVNAPIQFTLMDMNGRICWQQEISSISSTNYRLGYAMSRLAHGVYILRAVQNGSVITKKIQH